MSNNWLVAESQFDPQELRFRETLFAIGNGYLGTRGAFEEGYPDEQAATLVNGVFDAAPIVFTELANVPNWITLEVFLEGERFRLDLGRLLDYRRELNLHTGLLSRKLRWRSPQGKTTQLEFERFASLVDEHVLGVRLQVTPLDWSGEVELRASIPSCMSNEGLLHWKSPEQGSLEAQSAYLKVETRSSQIELCEAFHLEAGPQAVYSYWDSLGQPTVTARFNVESGKTYQADKLVTIYASRDVPEVQKAASEKLAQAVQSGYEVLREANRQAWEGEWQRCDVAIDGDDEAALAIHYSLFQMLIAAPRHDDRLSIPAKGLTGFGYRGHAFWDTEVYVLPFFTYTSPHLARNMLMYRYHTLPGARRKAHESGFEGAMYAWESASTGDEVTPRYVIGSNGIDLIRIWPGDIELHISSDIAYSVMQYWQVTGDEAFFRDYGAEIVLDTARFWGSRAEWNAAENRYEICDVIGPDENHDHVDNNVYTNYMAVWNLRTALKVLDWLEQYAPEKAAALKQELDLAPERLEHWQDVIARIFIPYDPDRELYEQFDGFFGLKRVDQEDYEPRTQSFQALLGIQGVQAYQLIKQPDVLMLFYLLSGEFSQEQLKANYAYYTPTTDLSLGSSLGPAVQSILSARLGDRESAYNHFIQAARTDLLNVRGNAGDGSHAATHGGLWQAAVFGFGGLTLTEDGPQARPALPEGWKRLAFKVQYRGQSYDFDLRPAESTLSPNGRVHPSLPIRGAIFDLDGVLTDTSELHYQAWKRLADEEGIPFSRKENEDLRGVDRRESLLRLLKGRTYPEEKLQEMMDRKNRYYVESISNLDTSDLLPGGLALLEQLRRAGIRIAIGSASKNAKAVVEKLGLRPEIDAIADGYSVKRQKPAPDLFLHAASLLGLPPEHCVVFEDAEAGIEAAQAGGMWSVGIGPRSRVGAADLVLPNLEGVEWQQIRNELHKSVAETDSGLSDQESS